MKSVTFCPGVVPASPRLRECRPGCEDWQLLCHGQRSSVNLEKWVVLTPTSTLCGNTYHGGERGRRACSCIVGTSVILAKTGCRLSRDLGRLKPATHPGTNLRLHKCTLEMQHKGEVKARAELKPAQILTMLPTRTHWFIGRGSKLYGLRVDEHKISPIRADY